MPTIKKTIIDLFEIDKMAPEEAALMIERLGKLVFQKVLIRVLPLLSKEDMTEYEKIIDSQEGPEVLFKFFGDKVPNFENIVKEEAENLRTELAGEFAKAKI